MVVRLILAVLGLFHLANGLVMLLAPDAWAASVVHLSAPDHLHHHFITDIGFAFVASGAGMLLGARRAVQAGVWAVAGAVWAVSSRRMDHGRPAAGDGRTDQRGRRRDFGRCARRGCRLDSIPQGR